MAGWIKVHRKLLDNPIFSNPDLLKVWLWCMLKASHSEHEQMVGLQKIQLEKGQFIFGRKRASIELDMTESKVYRAIKTLEELESISIRANNKFSLISVKNWSTYQFDEQQMNSYGIDKEKDTEVQVSETEQQMNNKRTTNEQQANTNKNVKNIKNVNNYKDIVEYLNEKTGRAYKFNTKSTTAKIKARLEEGFSVDDFKRVIDIKTREWLNDAKMQSYLRPETLFGTKFEGYLNQGEGRYEYNQGNNQEARKSDGIDLNKFLR